MGNSIVINSEGAPGAQALKGMNDVLEACKKGVEASQGAGALPSAQQLADVHNMLFSKLHHDFGYHAADMSPNPREYSALANVVSDKMSRENRAADSAIAANAAISPTLIPGRGGQEGPVV